MQFEEDLEGVVRRLLMDGRMLANTAAPPIGSTVGSIAQNIARMFEFYRQNVIGLVHGRKVEGAAQALAA